MGRRRRTRADAAPPSSPQGDPAADGEPATGAGSPRATPGRSPTVAHLRRRVGLRNRITLLFPALTLVLTALVSLGVYQVVRTSQLSSRESEARKNAFFNASVLQERLEQGSPQVTGNGAESHTDIGKAVDALARPSGGESGLLSPRDGGTAAWYTTNSAAFSVTDPPRALLAEVVDERQAVIQRFRLRGEPVMIVGVPIESVRASYFELTPLDDLQQTLDNLAIALPGAVALTTVVAILLGNWVARTTLAPLAEVSRAAEAIAADKLDTRLPVSTDPEMAGIVNSFNNMAAALEQRLARDARFASDVSHELRSPLMTLAASVEVLQRRREEMPERAGAALDLLAADVARFQSLVADLLEISRFDSGAQELELTEMAATEFLRHAGRAIAGRPVPVHHRPGLEDLTIVADKRRLVQVLTNLVDNAAKYANGVTAITLDKVPGGVEIGVEDDGPGVPEDERALIFERFARGGSAGRRGSDGGTGLGLSLVAEHVRLHGGEVWCEPARTNPTGARFALFLPTHLGSLADDEAEEPMGVGAEP